MDSKIEKKRMVGQKRAWRVRKKLRGSAQCPRLSVFKGIRHLQVQLIDDENGRTLAGTSTYAKQFKNTQFNRKSKEAATALGEFIGKVAREQHIEEVIFDRGRFKYHGIVAALADGARSAGLKF
jgi:large subunit ribosomal protein L18